MVGVDIVNVDRVAKLNKKEAFIEKVLTNQEREYLHKKSTKINNQYSEHDYSLAGFWAAKEAVLKALELGLIEDLQNIEILHKPNGAPYVNLDKDFCKKHNISTKTSIHISISHDAGCAICMCYIA